MDLWHQMQEGSGDIIKKRFDLLEGRTPHGGNGGIQYYDVGTFQ